MGSGTAKTSVQLSVPELIAHSIVRIVRELGADIAVDIRRNLHETAFCQMEFLRGRMSREEALRVVEICKDAPKLFGFGAGHSGAANTMAEILHDLKNWPPDEVLVETMLGDIKWPNEFEFIDWSSRAVPKGRFQRVTCHNSIIGVLGLKGTGDYEGQVIQLAIDTMSWKVRKVVRCL